MLQIFRAVSAVLLLVTIALISALITMRLAIHGAEVRVPSLAGMTLPEAVLQLRARDLEAGIDGRFYSSTQPAGDVLTQSPAPGTLVRKSWRMRVTVSLGPQKAAVPSVDGMNETMATITIRRTGLQMGNVIAMPYAYAPENTVIAQSPIALATDVQGPRVSILTAQSAPQPENADVMPDFTGENFTQAALAVIHAGFTLAPLQNTRSQVSTAATTASSATTVNQPMPSSPTTPAALVPPGTVISQVPLAGTRIPLGATIQLSVQP
jgi:beta-lactam-binding protein with PASTA domain